MHDKPFDIARSAGQQLHRFHGGLRLRHNKKISCRHPVERPPLPVSLVVPLLQHIGPAAECLVEPGQAVLKGERIGRATSSKGAHVHAPSSGIVEAVEQRLISHPSGQEGLCVVIRPDGEDQWVPLQPIGDWHQTGPDVLREHIRSMGIVGLGGAVFPTGRKTEAASAARIHTLIINGAECEPYISCDEMLMREHPEKIVLGARILRHALGADQAIIAIEDQMGAVRKALRQAVREQAPAHMQVKRIQTIYPEGGERQLIQVLTGLEVPAGGYPHDLGLVCQNVATAAAVADAVTFGRPLVERYVSVTGNGVREPRNLLALMGTPVKELVQACEGYTEDAARLVVGGAMMGYTLTNDDEPMVKATNCLLVLNEADIASPQPEMPCIRCGECSRVCPALLLPQELHFYLQSGQWDQAAKLGVEACIECGCCDIVCPSHIPLVDWFRFGKGELRQQAQERTISDQSRQRFEARERRLVRFKAENRERLAQRKRELKDKAGRDKQVAAAIERAGKHNSAEDGVGES